MLPSELQKALQESEQKRQTLGASLLETLRKNLHAELMLKVREDELRDKKLQEDLSTSRMEMLVKHESRNERQEYMKAEGNYLFARMLYEQHVEAHNSLKAQIRLLEMEAKNQI